MKKQLTEKQQNERKAKTKKIIKRIIDILVYSFAVVMALGLLVGGCQSKQTKKASAYYYGDSVAYSISDVPVTDSSRMLFYYHYDYNVSSTFPGFKEFSSSGLSMTGVNRVRFTPSITIDNEDYSVLNVEYSSTNPYHFSLYVETLGGDYIEIVRIYFNSGISVLRADLLNSIFSGARQLYLYDSSSRSKICYQFFAYYFGDIGFNRVNVELPYNLQQFYYLFNDVADTSLNDYFGGLFFVNNGLNVDFDLDNVHYQTSVPISLFEGSFRCNGIYYNKIEAVFTTVYGYRQIQESNSPHAQIVDGEIYYQILNSEVYSYNEDFNGYIYLDYIRFVGSSSSNVVYKTFDETPIIPSSGTSTIPHYVYEYNPHWVGDTYTSNSPYRSFYVLYAYCDNDVDVDYYNYFPNLSTFNYGSFLSFIGDVYDITIPTSIVNDDSVLITNVFTWFHEALKGIMPFFTYTLIPGFTIGTLVMVPFTITIILFVVRLFKR